jgi:hypothetical protein
VPQSLTGHNFVELVTCSKPPHLSGVDSGPHNFVAAFRIRNPLHLDILMLQTLVRMWFKKLRRPATTTPWRFCCPSAQ